MNTIPPTRTPPMRVPVVVLSARDLSPSMRQLVFGGPDLKPWLGLDGVGDPAAWVKVLPPNREGRAYTIRRLDKVLGTLTIDFVLHGLGADAGSVADWARFAREGDSAEIAGPRDGGFNLLPDSSWLWIAADATGLPAAQAIFEATATKVVASALFVVHDEHERTLVHWDAPNSVEWRYTLALPQRLSSDDSVLRRLSTLTGPGQVWIAGEADWMKSWRQFWMEERQLDRQRISGKGYWRLGERNHKD